MALKISATQISYWRICPFQFYLSYIEQNRPPVWIKLVFGSTIHRTIAGFYRLNEKQRIERIKRKQTLLFPQSKKAAIGMWIRNWQEATKDRENIRFESGKTQENQIRNLLELGASMIGKYWEDNRNSPFPVALEKRFTVPVPGIKGVAFIGSIDQIRKIENRGQEEYWLVDLKTSWQDYGIEDPRVQYPVHHDYQFTLYALAFRFIYKIKEAGIIRYPLGHKGTSPFTEEKIDKSAIITSRTIEDFLELIQLVACFLRACQEELFFKNYGDHCRICDFLEICSRWRKTSVPLPVKRLRWGEMDPEKTILFLEEIAKEQRIKQPRLF